MREVTVFPSRLRGEVEVPPSKSAAHRAMFCAALAEGRSVLRKIAPSDDMPATLGAVRAIGRSAALSGDTLEISGPCAAPSAAAVDCRESGSTLRFFIPVLGALGIPAELTGRGRLPQRPIGCYLDCLPPHGLRMETAGGLPLGLSGKLTPGEYALPGNISSQFLTGLLLALPLLGGDSVLRLTTPLESAGYVDMTLDVMRAFGVQAEAVPGGWKIPGGQRYRAREYAVEGDWSQAAFFLEAAALGGEITLRGLRPDSTQGDRAALGLFSRWGVRAGWEGGRLSAAPGTWRELSVDASQIPDLVPALAATAARAPGRTRIYNAGRLRLKESDRLRAMAQGLAALGVPVEEGPDSLEITGGPVRGGKVEGFHDHRIVMAFAVLACAAEGPVQITDAESVSKSYPAFWADLKRMGGNIDGLDLG